MNRKSGKTEKQEELRISIAWYKPEQWARLLEISEDRDDLERTHEEWRLNAEATLRVLAAQGLPASRVTVDVEALLAWCGERGRPVNGGSRSGYAAWLSHKSLTQGRKEKPNAKPQGREGATKNITQGRQGAKAQRTK